MCQAAHAPLSRGFGAAPDALLAMVQWVYSVIPPSVRITAAVQVYGVCGVHVLNAHGPLPPFIINQPTNQPTNQPALEATAGKHQEPNAASPETETECAQLAIRAKLSCDHDATVTCSQLGCARMYGLHWIVFHHATFGTNIHCTWPTWVSSRPSGQSCQLTAPRPGTRLRRLPGPIGGRMRQEQKSFLLATRRTSNNRACC